MKKVLQNSCLLLLTVGWWACHPPPPAPPAPPPPPKDEEPPPPQIPEVVKNELDLAASDGSGCNLYNEAAEQIWGYGVQSNLQLSVLIFEGKILASDAEQLTTRLTDFSEGWKERFAALCAHKEKDAFSQGRFVEASQCLQRLLDVQKNYVNDLFHTRDFSVQRAEAVAAEVGACDQQLTPDGEKTFKSNPF